MECRCIIELSEIEKKRYAPRYLEEAHYINRRTEVVIVYSKLKQPIYIAINKTHFVVKNGYNKICLCNISNNLQWDLCIGANYLCRLEKIPYKNTSIEVYVLKAYDHKDNCINNTVPSLLSLTFFALFLENIVGGKLEELYKEGSIPKVLFHNRQRAICQLIYFEAACETCQTGQIKIPSCINPDKHINANPVTLPIN